jgi:hypothetical protein
MYSIVKVPSRAFFKWVGEARPFTVSLQSPLGGPCWDLSSTSIEVAHFCRCQVAKIYTAVVQFRPAHSDASQRRRDRPCQTVRRTPSSSPRRSRTRRESARRRTLTSSLSRLGARLVRVFRFTSSSKSSISPRSMALPCLLPVSCSGSRSPLSWRSRRCGAESDRAMVTNLESFGVDGVGYDETETEPPSSTNPQ